MTYVGTVCRVIADAVTRRVTTAEPVNLAFASRRTLLDVVRELGTLLDSDLKHKHLDPRPGDVRHSQADCTQLTQLFPDVEPIDFESLPRTVAWFRASQSATMPP